MNDEGNKLFLCMIFFLPRVRVEKFVRKNSDLAFFISRKKNWKGRRNVYIRKEKSFFISRSVPFFKSSSSLSMMRDNALEGVCWTALSSFFPLNYQKIRWKWWFVPLCNNKIIMYDSLLSFLSLSSSSPLKIMTNKKDRTFVKQR